MNKTIAYLGLGANVGNREQNIADAVNRLNSDPEITVLRSARFFVSEPFGMIEQKDFLNTAVEIETGYSASGLLDTIKSIEHEMGREQHSEWGPRNIDIDILFYGDNIVVSTDLVIPHPLACERVFVLKPMMELNSTFVHPVFEKSIADIYHERESELNLYHCMER